MATALGATLQAYTSFFNHRWSLSRFVSHVTSALRLVDDPLVVLYDTTALIRGASILSAVHVWYRPRVDALQMRALVKFAREDLGRADIADKNGWLHATSVWYGAGKHSALHVAVGQTGELAVLTVTWFHCKLQTGCRDRASCGRCVHARPQKTTHGCSLV